MVITLYLDIRLGEAVTILLFLRIMTLYLFRLTSEVPVAPQRLHDVIRIFCNYTRGTVCVNMWKASVSDQCNYSQMLYIRQIYALSAK